MEFNKAFETEYNKMKSTPNRYRKPFSEVLKQHKDDIKPYLQLVTQMLPTDIVYMEIGLCWGGSFVLTGNVLKQCGKNISGIGIDLPNTALWGGAGINPRDEIPYLAPQFPYQIIIGDSHRQETVQAVIDILQDKKVDLLFIDGDHSMNGCLHDFDLYSSFVKSDGLIALHDIVPWAQCKHVNVHRVWRYLKKLYQNWEFTSTNVNYGIGVLRWDSVVKTDKFWESDEAR